MCSTLRQVREGRRFLDNCYPEVVQPGGNRSAQRCLAERLDLVDATWCGVGVVPASGFDLKPRLAAQNVRELFPSCEGPGRKHLGAMPAGCERSRVVPGKIYPNECRLFVCPVRHAVPSQDLYGDG